MKYLVEQLYHSGWEDAQWTEDFKPLRFNSVDDGERAIDEFIAAHNSAEENGDMHLRVIRELYRVAPAPEPLNPLLHENTR